VEWGRLRRPRGSQVVSKTSDTNDTSVTSDTNLLQQNCD
jgi:hypothetical protein